MRTIGHREHPRSEVTASLQKRVAAFLNFRIGDRLRNVVDDLQQIAAGNETLPVARVLDLDSKFSGRADEIAWRPGRG